ncbi:MAG: radical SAM protein [Dehalococcoidales bacterium]|nr:radical SAM protein [Dehalococcoidales bacterium]
MEKKPYLVDWAITHQCNLKCRHCRGMRVGEMDSTRAKEIINEIAELKPGWVIIEGGEALLRKDLFDILKLARQKGLDVHLISNGTLLNVEIRTILKQLGVKLMISIDGATKETYESIRRGAKFEKVVRAAKEAASDGLLESINFTLMKDNYLEIPGIMALAASIGLKRVTFIGLKSCESYENELLSAKEYAEAIRLACDGAVKTGVEFYFDEPFFWPVVKEQKLQVGLPTANTGIVSQETNACIFGEYLFIEPNGEVKPCSFAPMVLGNVKEKSLVTIWQDNLASPLMERIRSYTSRTGNCKSCKYLTDCKGCRSRTFVLTGDWFAADPVCPIYNKSEVNTK